MIGECTERLTLKRLTDVLDYDPLTGEFTWAINGRRMRKGQKAGTETQGYINIQIDSELHRAHRLAWFYMRGRWPTTIDHINGDGIDNRIANLREATRSQNIANSRTRSDSKSGIKGIRERGGRWLAQIRHNGKRIHIGVYATAEEAHQAYLTIAKELFGDFARSK